MSPPIAKHDAGAVSPVVCPAMFPFWVAMLMLILSVGLHTIACGITLRVGNYLLHTKPPLGFWRGVFAMQASALILMASHFVQIILWAIPLLYVHELRMYGRAFYFSMQNYTTLGLGDVIIADDWRILGPMEAATGVLMFGLSTAIMFQLRADVAQTRAASKRHH
jgi:hypothetical protein